MDIPPSFPSLTPDERVWRLSWFGNCAYPGSVRRYAQPSIKVVLTPLLCDPDDQAALILPECADNQHSHETWAPIAALPMLTIGDLWQNGQQFASPDYQTESFKRLSITPETTSFVKAGLAIDEHFLLPLRNHPWHRLHTQSYCVAISLDAQRRLLIPCIEIIRFYFGSSSNFLQRLFTAPLTPETLWSHKRFNPATRHLHLVLANRLSGLSCEDIGRIAESKFAWRAAAGIHASCQKASVNGHPVYPYTGFPFEGITDLSAKGIWVPFGEQEEATFLVYRLNTCSHPFPFQSLSYEAGDRKARYRSTGDQNGEAKKFAHSRSRPQKTEAPDADPGANRVQRKMTFFSQRRFTDLQHKPVWRDKVETMPNADVFLHHEDGRLEQVAIGESACSSATPGVDMSVAAVGGTEKKKLAALPWFVQTGLRNIEVNPAYQSPDRRLRVVCPVGKQEPVFSLPVVVNEDGVIASQLFFTGEGGSSRQRRACFVEIAHKHSPIQILLILEGKARVDWPHIVPVAGTDLKLAIEVAMLSLEP